MEDLVLSKAVWHLFRLKESVAEKEHEIDELGLFVQFPLNMCVIDILPHLLKSYVNYVVSYDTKTLYVNDMLRYVNDIILELEKGNEELKKDFFGEEILLAMTAKKFINVFLEKLKS
jgi:hypothetical protein